MIWRQGSIARVSPARRVGDRLCNRGFLVGDEVDKDWT